MISSYNSSELLLWGCLGIDQVPAVSCIIPHKMCFFYQLSSYITLGYRVMHSSWTSSKANSKVFWTEACCRLFFSIQFHYDTFAVHLTNISHAALLWCRRQTAFLMRSQLTRRGRGLLLQLRREDKGSAALLWFPPVCWQAVCHSLCRSDMLLRWKCSRISGFSCSNAKSLNHILCSLRARTSTLSVCVRYPRADFYTNPTGKISL